MIVPVTLVIMEFAKMASTATTVFANLASQAPSATWRSTSAPPAPAETVGPVLMRRTGSTASVPKVSSRRTATLRWTSAEAAPVSTAPAGTTSTATVAIVNLGGWERTATWTEMTVCQVPVRMLAPASTNSMVLAANVDKALEGTFAKSTSTSARPAHV